MDLNADLGEGEPCDSEMLELVTSTSVASGGHAGDPSSMLAIMRRAAQRDVVLGAHPSYWDRDGFGRRDQHVDRSLLAGQIAYQVGAAAAVARAAGTRIRFVKAHGALYNRAGGDLATAGALLDGIDAAEDFSAGVDGQPLAVLAAAGSLVERLALERGRRVFAEVFADRAYRADGSLVGRSEPGSVLTDPGSVATRALELAAGLGVESVDGRRLLLRADSICLHGDTPGAVGLATSVRRALEEAGLPVRPFLDPGGAAT